MKIKNKIYRLYRLCPVRWVLLILSAAFTGLHLLLRKAPTAMHFVVEHAVRPLHKAMSVFWSGLPFSAAELLIGTAVLLTAAYLFYQICTIVSRPEKLKRLFRTFISFAAAAGVIYSGFCFLWGMYYYDDDFVTRAGLSQEPVSTQQLRAVTELFVSKVNEYSGQVSRDENGIYNESRSVLLQRSAHIFDEVEELFPALEGPDIPVKGIHFSKIMSAADFTGFFFPFTAEANVNLDFPPSLLAATCAHEISHQRGVSREQEANFVAVLASLESSDPDYCYSASLLAYIYLGNALYSADYAAWESIYSQLEADAIKDLQWNSRYWENFKTPVKTVSNSIYEGFLYSYDQELGLKSYGACVDLLVNYYYAEAVDAQAK